jgi:type I restriction-modification system DNA methylase subunit/predicted type IV restriction endonuclease
MVTKEQALEKIKSLVERFNEQIEYYKKGEYKETQTRRDFIDPFWKALGWDVDNESGCAESYREVIHEDRVKVGGATKAPDYSFRLAGGKRLFFLEAKKPSVVIKDETAPAYQVRRYGWSAKMPISVITDFEEFAIYDCSTKPKETDKASNGRIKYLTYLDYLKEFDFIWHTFSKEYVLKGSFDKYITSDKNKKGTTTVDAEFLQSLDKWRVELAVNIALRNKNINEDELNFIVQHTIDRIIFLRIAEDRSAERYGDLQDCIKSGDFYQNLLQRFHIADQKYNSGLFDFAKDKISDKITIDNKVVKNTISELYYPICPYEFSVLSVEILGSAYEQFLGKQITLSKSGKATIEEKPEVRKAGGVYYTPQYIVEYIVKNTIGKLVENKTPKEISQLKICDPACGSGSFLIGAYQFLLNWHKDFYNKLKPENGKLTIKGSKSDVLTPTGELTTAEKKRILLNNIYGVDLDNNAVEVTKLSLLLKCMEGETKETIEAQTKLFHDRILPTLDNNIKSGNSLIDLDYYDGQFEFEERKIKPFSWQKAFPEVFNRNVEIDKRLPFKKQYDKVKQLEDDTQDFIAQFVVEEPITEFNKKQNGGFDCIIGNPPYVKVADKNIFDYFNKKFVHQDYQQDLYLLFLEQYKNLLVIGGKLGVIIPNTWLQSIKFRNIRKYLLNDFYWERILHIKEHIFKAVVDTHVLVFERNNYIKNYDVVIDVFEKKEITLLHIIDQNKLPDNGDIINILANEKDKKLFEKIKNNSSSVQEISTVYNGVKPFEKGKGKPAQTTKIMLTKPYVTENEAKPKIGKNWLPLMRGSLMNRYTNFWDNNSWINYGEWLAAPRSPAVFEAEEKIIVRQTGDRIIATLIGSNIICRNNLHILISNEINHKFILGILNSKLTDFYYQQINPERGEALAEVKKQHVEQLPIPKGVSEKQQTEIIKHVEQLLQLNKDKQNATLPNQLEMISNRIEHTEDKINQIVYVLYELNADEINRIETT